MSYLDSLRPLWPDSTINRVQAAIEARGLSCDNRRLVDACLASFGAGFSPEAMLDVVDTSEFVDPYWRQEAITARLNARAAASFRSLDAYIRACARLRP